MEVSPLCRALRACAYSCRHSETTQPETTNRNTGKPWLAANPRHTAQPETTMTAVMPRKTGLFLRSSPCWTRRIGVTLMGRLRGRHRAAGEPAEGVTGPPDHVIRDGDSTGSARKTHGGRAGFRPGPSG